MLSLILLSYQDACTLPANTPTSVDYINNCFRLVPFDEKVRESTITTMQSLVSIYAFAGQANNTNAFNIPPVDIQAELTKIKSAAYTSDYDFHSSISKIFHRVYDAHTKYAMPQGYGQFQVISGVVPIFKNNEFVLEAVQGAVFQKVRQMQGLDEHVSKIIVKVNDTDPQTFFNQIAQKISFYEKDANARYNEYITEGVFKRAVRTYVDVATEPLTYEFADGTKATAEYMLFNPNEIISIETIKQKNLRQTTMRNNPLKQFLSELRLPKNLLKINKDTTQQTLYEGNDISCYQHGSTFVLTVPTFSPDKVESFVDDFQQCMKIMDQANDGRLIVNVAGNGGGYITLGYRMLAVLAPYVQPRWGKYQIIKNDINKFFVDSKDVHNDFGTQERFDLNSGKIFEKGEWFNKSESHFDHTFSGKYSFDLAYDEKPKSVYDSLLNTKTPHWLKTSNNNKLVFVTDGTCGSTCACFMMRGAEAHAGLYLQLGGTPLNPLTSVASFAGGSVMATSTTDLFDLSAYNINKFPTSASFGWAHEQVYSFNDPELTLEYKPVRTDDSIPVHWDQSGWYSVNKLEEIAVAVEQKTECYSFMHIEDSDCEKKDRNGIYARYCVEGTYKGECTLVACQLDYQIENGKCTRIPLKHTDKDNNTVLIICLSTAGAAVILIAMGIIFYYCWKNKQDRNPLEEVKLVDA
ncbi:Conserved_hypothetical protein [Hexamita inflata]|uniref:Tail specific protease domain-containing protein n=1 Tax=Hexamita inflata TaxID=28002 RepID=A0AA86QD87_9EUKA|nr:Conserved hypothetical protein [Hexamita inflata]